MTGESARSGELGKVIVDDVDVARCTKWSVNPVVSESAWGDCDSQGYTNRKRARYDATGTCEGKFDEDDPVYDLLMPGDTPKLALWEDTVDYWVFPRVLIQSFEVEYDMDSKEVVGWSFDFGADGIYYRPGQAGAPTQTLPT